MAKIFGMIVFVGIALAAFSEALTLNNYQELAPGVWDTWNKVDAANVQQGRFGMTCSDKRLWLVSRRLYRTGFDDPWDPASRGGIVSTLNAVTGNWTSHKSYNRLDADEYGDKLFSLNGRLFMLTFSTNQKKIVYHKLFFWDDSSAQWLETPFDIDATASTISTNDIVHLAVNVPDQSGKVAYFVASSHGYANKGSEMVYSKLQVDFRGTNIPVKATLKTIAREKADKPSAVIFTAVHGGSLYSFVQHFYSEGYVSEYDFVYVIDLKTNNVSTVALTGTHPPMYFDDERMFQNKDEIFIVGGSQPVGLTEMQPVSEIWSLNLKTLEWKSTGAVMPDNAGSNVAFDQQNSKLYFSGLEEGVKVAQVSS